MASLRLRTQLLVAALLTICTLLAAVLLVVRHTVRSEISEGVRQSTEASLHAFQVLQRERDVQLSQTAALLAELPTLKAVMATQHEPTIQDASEPFWKLAGSQLFVLSSSDGRIFAFHMSTPGWEPGLAEADLKKSVEDGDSTAWWYGNGQLYRVFLRPILAGSDDSQRQLGNIAIGYKIDLSVAEQLSIASGSQIALATGNEIIATTLSTAGMRGLRTLIAQGADTGSASREILLGETPYQVASVSFQEGRFPAVKCYVLMPLQPTNAFIARLNRRIVLLGVSAILVAGLLLILASRTITRPLDDLVAGVRALAQGDYSYSVNPAGSSEVAELGAAFAKMRSDLRASEERRFVTERVAALGRAARSISHDLRHYLAAVVANAEFLYEAEKLKLNRDEIYGEIKTAAEQITDLLDSLRELSREDVSIAPRLAAIDQTVRRAVDAARVRSEMKARAISVRSSGNLAGVFDPQKMERALFNLVLNACEASAQVEGAIEVDIRSVGEFFEIRVSDCGPGVSPSIRQTLFEPFVSFGKSNGTGLGLAIVHKVIHDHGGSVAVESTGASGTTFLVRFPRAQPVSSQSTQMVNS
jgi:signal transduction histidine kinase